MPGQPIVDLRKTWGCTFIGLAFSMLLFGITVCQTWIYSWQYAKRDSKPLRFFVLAVFLFDTFHTILCIYSVYWYLILNFGNVENLGYNMWAMNLQVVINSFVPYLVQLFYARRVYIVSKSLIIPTIIVLFGTTAFALVFLFLAKASTMRDFSRYNTFIPITWIGMGSCVAADTLIACSMCWSLYRQKTGFARTDSVIMTLMSYSINSGLLTCILAIAVLVTFCSNNKTMIWEVFSLSMAKLYANSLLAMLNSRDHLRERSTSTTNKTDNAYNLSSFRATQGGAADKSYTDPTTVSISVHQSETTEFAEVKHSHDIESTMAEPR